MSLSCAMAFPWRAKLRGRSGPRVSCPCLFGDISSREVGPRARSCRAVAIRAPRHHSCAVSRRESWIRRGVVITDVAKGAPWNYDRLQSPPLPGDVLARINGIRPRNLEDVGLLLERVKPGEPAHFVLLRVKNNLATAENRIIQLEAKLEASMFRPPSMVKEVQE